MIGDDVAGAVEAVDGVHSVEVVWLAAPLWTTERITPSARLRLARGAHVVVGAAAPCPARGGGLLRTGFRRRADACRRAVRRCAACGEVVEQVRT